MNDSQEELDETDPSEKTFQIAGQLGGMKVAKPSSFEQQLEARRRAREIKNFLFGEYLRLSPIDELSYFSLSGSNILMFGQMAPQQP